MILYMFCGIFLGAIIGTFVVWNRDRRQKLNIASQKVEPVYGFDLDSGVRLEAEGIIGEHLAMFLRTAGCGFDLQNDKYPIIIYDHRRGKALENALQETAMALHNALPGILLKIRVEPDIRRD